MTLSEPFRKSLDCLWRLHLLRMEGKHDSDEADLVRDEADPFWYPMTDEERELWGVHSEKLYEVSDAKPDDEEEVNLEDYRNAPGGVGPLAYEWKDKPHRLVYALCREIKRLRSRVPVKSHLAAAAEEPVRSASPANTI